MARFQGARFGWLEAGLVLALVTVVGGIVFAAGGWFPLNSVQRASRRAEPRPVRDPVALALEETMGSGSREQKLALLDSILGPSPTERDRLCWALGDAARDGDPDVRRAADRALRRIEAVEAATRDLPEVWAGEPRLLPADPALGVAVWLGGTAWRVHRHPVDQITHLMQNRETGALSERGHSLPRRFLFLSQYRRALLGRRWPGDYPCECRMEPDPRLRELASASESRWLIPQMNRVGRVHTRAAEHQSTAQSLAESIAFDEQRIRDLDAAARGRMLHGSEGVRKALQHAIDANRKSLEAHERLYRLYHVAAVSPTILTDPDVVEP